MGDHPDRSIDIDRGDGDDSRNEDENAADLANLSLGQGLTPRVDMARAQSVADGLSRQVAQTDIDAAQLPLTGAHNPRELQLLISIDTNVKKLVEKHNALEAKVNEILQRGDGFKTRFLFNAFKVMSALGAVATIYFGVKRMLDGHDASFVSLVALDPRATPATSATPATPATPATDAEALDPEGLWKRSAPDQPFWDGLADFVDANAPRSASEQLMFMQYTEDLGQYLMTANWQWNSAQDKLDLIDSFATSIAQTGLAATYRMIAGRAYLGKPLPRAIAANLLALAISQWSDPS